MATVTAPPVAHAFVDALAAQDFDRVRACLAPDVRLRAVVPRGVRLADGADEALALFTRWFGDAEDVVVLACEIGAVEDRTSLGYRFELTEDGRRVVEQRGYADVVDGRIRAIDLVCSGFRLVLS